MRRFYKNQWFGLLLLAVIIGVIPLFASSNYVLRVAALIWIMSLAAVGLHILMGLAGQISLGQAGYFAIGAYAMAILPKRYNFSPLLALFVGVIVSAVIAFLVGKPILRLKGHYLAIATLGFSLIIALIINSEVTVTGGPDGIDVTSLTVAGRSILNPSVWYWIAAGVLLAGIALSMQLRASPTGRALRGILDSEHAAASMGIDVAQKKLQAFVIAAIYADIAGSTLALMNGFITPDVASFMSSVEFVAMVVIGGAASPFGALGGAALLTIIPQLFATFQDFKDVAVGLMIMLAMIFLPQGIIPSLATLFPRETR